MPIRHILKMLDEEFDATVDAWIAAQGRQGLRRSDLFNDAERTEQCRSILRAFAQCLRGAVEGEFHFKDPVWEDLRAALADVTRLRVRRGVTPVDMAGYVLALKTILFERLRARHDEETADLLIAELLFITQIVDESALYTTELCIEERDQQIERQRREMLELSTPVVELFESVLAVPLIGTLDSTRAKEVMENLLEAIMDKQARVVIVDITGVATIDTQVAQHLLRTAAAVRLMGADCILSGISPKIAQTVVQLGVDVGNVTTRSTLRSALTDALDRVGFRIARASA